MIQQKRHYKCQSLWPWSTQDTIPWTEVMSLVVSDWQMYKQPYLWYCCSWTWGKCHLCHFTTIAISPNVLITLSPPSGSQFASLAICPPLSIHRFTAALNAHVVVIHIFKLIIISLGFCWVIYFLIPTSFFFSIRMVHEIHTNQRREWKREYKRERMWDKGYQTVGEKTWRIFFFT